MGRLCEGGYGVRRKPRRAFTWYRKAAEAGDGDALAACERLAREHGFQLSARIRAHLLARCATTGDPEEAVNLGVCLFEGSGVQRDRRRALELYRYGAALGQSAAWVNIGLMYKQGDVLRRSWPKALACFRTAARLGKASACYQLAQYYETVAPDRAHFMRWLRLGARRGHAQSQLELGILYHNGNGVRRDWKRSALLYRRAADQNHGWAMCLLGLCCRDGEGVKEDKRTARWWFERAVKAGLAEKDSETVREARKALAAL